MVWTIWSSRETLRSKGRVRGASEVSCHLVTFCLVRPCRDLSEVAYHLGGHEGVGERVEERVEEEVDERVEES